MNKKEIEQYLIDFQKNPFPSLIDRSLKVNQGKKITSIIGPRRAGKTSFLYLQMKHLLDKGRKKEELLYLNFENTRLFDLKFREIKDVIQLHRQLFKVKPMLFFDEPQAIENWDKAVRELHDEEYTISLSGSSSKMLSKEIASNLRGRSLSYLLLPFSFKEFLAVRGMSILENISTDEKTKILSFLDEYLEFGGFPEVVLENDTSLKLKILESYFDLTIYKDIIERHGVKDSLLIKWFIKSVVSSYSKELSIHKLYLTLKSQDRKVSKDELYTYSSYLADALFMFPLPKFSWSVRKREVVSKIYLCDEGFSKLMETTKDLGRKMENIVFLELTRNLDPLTEIFFWKNVQLEEVDLVVKKEGKIDSLIQVCANPSDNETKQREVRALLKAGKELKCSNLLVLCEDYEAEEDAEWFGIKGKVKYVPLWKWLIGVG